MSEHDPGWRAAVTTAALDPYRSYASALRNALPHPVRVLDAFHRHRLTLIPDSRQGPGV
jgi:transposase